MKTPDKKGFFGKYGGRFAPETLVGAVEELELSYRKARRDKKFREELDYYLKNYVGRPSPLYLASKLSGKYGARIYLKREDLNHTGAHKINNCMGQILLARRMGKKRIIAETGAGQHGVATATVAAMFGLECEIFMGELDVARQEQNVFRMQLLGAKVNCVKNGTRTLKDAMNEALRDWIKNVDGTYYLMGTVSGFHPYPEMVRNFQSIIGNEARKQVMLAEGRLPDYLVACVGGGSNAMGLFYPFINDKNVRMMGIEAGGLGTHTKEHAARFEGGRVGVLHGTKTYLLQDKNGQIMDTHSISAGLDYSGVGPEHSYLHDLGRVKYASIKDNEAVDAFMELTRLEGIMPALESSHALAYLKKMKLRKNDIVIVNLSGRGDKDMGTIREYLSGREGKKI
jgi:tryptophan synthase beta chain